MDDEITLQRLISTLPQVGRVEWIGLRPQRRARIHVVSEAMLIENRGIEGDRSANSEGGKRQVTLMQSEHLPVIAGCLGKLVSAEMFRRNLLIAGLNLLALKDKRFSIGEAVLEYSGICAPCSYMEDTLGPGGYNAMRGHGGITARVISGGLIRLHDELHVVGSE